MRKFILVILLAQLAVIGAMIWRYEQVVRNGIEFRVPCSAYDLRGPRNLRLIVGANVTAVTNHVIVANASTPGEGDLLGPGFVMVDRHSVTGAPPLLVYKDETPTLDPPFYFSVKRARFDHFNSTWKIYLRNNLYIPERFADNADRILSQSVSQQASNRTFAVFHAWKGDIVITDIEIDGIPIEKLASP